MIRLLLTVAAVAWLCRRLLALAAGRLIVRVFRIGLGPLLDYEALDAHIATTWREMGGDR